MVEKTKSRNAVDALAAGGKSLATSISSPLVTTLKAELSPIGTMSQALNESPELMMGMSAIGDAFSAMKTSMSDSWSLMGKSEKEKDTTNTEVLEETRETNTELLGEIKETNKTFLKTFSDGWTSFLKAFKKSQSSDGLVGPITTGLLSARVLSNMETETQHDEETKLMVSGTDQRVAAATSVQEQIEDSSNAEIKADKKENKKENKLDREQAALEKSKSESGEEGEGKKKTIGQKVKGGMDKGLLALFGAFKWILSIGKLFLGLGIAAVIAANGPEVISGFFHGLKSVFEWIGSFMKDPKSALENLKNGIVNFDWNKLIDTTLSAIGKAWDLVAPVIGDLISKIVSAIGVYLTKSFRNEEGEFEWGKLFSWDNIWSTIKKGGGLLAIGAAMSTLLFGLSNTISMIKMPFKMAGGAFSMAKGAAGLLGFGGDDDSPKRPKPNADSRKKAKKKGLKALRNKSGAPISKGWDKVQDMKKPNMGGIMGKLFDGLGKAGSFIARMGSKLIMPLVSMGPLGWSILGGIALGGLFYVFWDDISKVWGNVVNSISAGFTAVKEMVTGAFSNVQGMMGSWLRSIGAGMIADFIDPDGADPENKKEFTWGSFGEELWNIYKGLWGKIISTVKGIFSNISGLVYKMIPNWLLKMLGIKEPTVEEKTETALNNTAAAAATGGNVSPEDQKILDGSKSKTVREGRGGVGEIMVQSGKTNEDRIAELKGQIENQKRQIKETEERLKKQKDEETRTKLAELSKTIKDPKSRQLVLKSQMDIWEKNKDQKFENVLSKQKDGLKGNEDYLESLSNPKPSTVQEQKPKGKPSVIAKKIYEKTNQTGMHPENKKIINEEIKKQKANANKLIYKFQNPEGRTKGITKSKKRLYRINLRKNAEKNPIYRDIIGKDPKLIKELGLGDLYKKQDTPTLTKSQMTLNNTKEKAAEIKATNSSSQPIMVNAPQSTTTVNNSESNSLGSGPSSTFSNPSATSPVGS
jgi:hypothetical protein